MEVLLGTGEALAFDGLVIATGASARRLPTGLGGVGVHHIRTLEDATTLHTCPRRERAGGAGHRRRLPGLGGCLHGGVAGAPGDPRGGDSRADARRLGPQISAYCTRLHRSRGVDLRTRTTVLSLTPATGRPGTTVAVLANQQPGTRSQIEADIVVAALGATPNTGWLAGSGIDIEAGSVATDPSLTVLDTAGVPVAGIVAVGDVARVPQPLLDGRASRVEHWATAVGHSGIAAATLHGQQPHAPRRSRRSGPTSMASRSVASGSPAGPTRRPSWTEPSRTTASS